MMWLEVLGRVTDVVTDIQCSVCDLAGGLR